MRALVSAALVLALVAPALAGPKAPIDPDQARNDAALLQDDGAAMTAMQQRLRDLVGFRNGLLEITVSIPQRSSERRPVAIESGSEPGTAASQTASGASKPAEPQKQAA